MQLARSHRPCIDAATKQHLQRQCKRAARELALSCPSAACLIQRLCEASAMAKRGNAVLPDLTLPSRSLSYTKTMQTSEMRACSYISECSLSYTKTMRGERNGKTGKRSFTGLDTAEPKLVLYKDYARRAQRQDGETEFYRT